MATLLVLVSLLVQELLLALDMASLLVQEDMHMGIKPIFSSFLLNKFFSKIVLALIIYFS